MTAARQDYVVPPFYDAMQKFRDDISAAIRCCVPGTVKAVNTARGTVDVEVALLQKVASGVDIPYPILSDLPAFTLQGGGIAAAFPTQVGDRCLVVFCDRATSSWKLTGTPQPLPNLRMHDLSDGFALVGVNPVNSLLDLLLGPSEGGIASSLAKVAIDKDTGLVTIQNQTQNLATTLGNLMTALTALITALSSLTVNTGTGVVTPATVAALAAVQVQLTAVQAELTGLLY